jgi:hypothetical protein
MSGGNMSKTAEAQAATPVNVLVNGKINGKGINEWTSEDHAKDCPCHPAKPQRSAEGKPLNNKCINKTGECCPDELIINASNRPILVAALADVPKDQVRIDVGDRRYGTYYQSIINLPVGLGLQKVKSVHPQRLRELEKSRAQRTGEEPADWVKEVWAKKGQPGASALQSPHDSMSTLAKLAHGMGPE